MTDQATDAEIAELLERLDQGCRRVGEGDNGEDSYDVDGATDDMYQAAVALRNYVARLSASEGWRPTHRHIKSGGLYRVVGRGKIEADLSAVVVYESRGGVLWVRPTTEFDHRFEELPAIPEAAAPLQSQEERND